MPHAVDAFLPELICKSKLNRQNIASSMARKWISRCRDSTCFSVRPSSPRFLLKFAQLIDFLLQLALAAFSLGNEDCQPQDEDRDDWAHAQE